ncbi:DUF4192 domain-containing protein [Actinomycetospora termitidis]|uniref:DUF4192 domain-containing protein n=1 Tax=Actinomycetospora termitidis TaxID=3053470 RepID=A0ABT7M8C9_9PSEU|nr:DUF4192 domain-containing protein [Actinomycetospora sp. Odt1-22]MDL5156449.1 DUF4192 domain-containing protein [Actinomycetospora sp. Odt1-22]
MSITDPPDLVAALPPLFGFTPSESVVGLALHGRPGRLRLGASVRIDLGRGPDDDAVLAAAVRDRLVPTGPDAVIVVVVSADPVSDDGRPPHAGLVDAVTDAFGQQRVRVEGAVWAERVVAGGPWRCYDPCDCSGTLPDPGGTRTAAEMTGLGRVTYGSREEVAASLAPDPAARSRRRRDLVDDAHRAAALDRELAGPAAVRRDLATVRRAAAEVGRGGVLTEEEVAALAAALSDKQVRDVCLGFAAEQDPEVDPVHAEELWRVLVRAVPAPEVAEPATLLAFASLDHGGGATLTTALDRAWTADPEHELSRLLQRVLALGNGPEHARRIAVEGAAETRRRVG